MLSKNVIKDIQSLGLKKHRDEAGLFVAEGPKIVEELRSIVPGKIRAVYATQNWEKKQASDELISEEELQKISLLKTPNKVLAVVEMFEKTPVDTSGFALYLDAIQDPGNLGTIIRIADWFGVRHIVCSPGCAEIYNPKVIQSSMASIARVNVVEDESENWLGQQTVPIYAATLQGQNLYSFPKTETGILMIGNESKGIRQSFLHLATSPVTIPRRGEAESLNAAVATGILLSHLVG